MEALTPTAHELLAGPNFAVVATVSPNGSIQQSVVWIRERDGELEFSSLQSRVKTHNIERDPTVSVLIIDRENGYRYSAVRGHARLESSGANELIDELSHAYDNQPWPEPEPWQPRTRIIVTPTGVSDHG